MDDGGWTMDDGGWRMINEQFAVLNVGCDFIGTANCFFLIAKYSRTFHFSLFTFHLPVTCFLVGNGLRISWRGKIIGIGAFMGQLNFFRMLLLGRYCHGTDEF